MLNLISKNKRKFITTAVFIGFTTWWLILKSKHPAGDPAYQYFTATYGLMALLGAIWGIVISRKWGGRRSILGLAILMFAFGLLAQEFGQLAYNYYIYYKKVDIPYPSLGDIGYFGSVLFYIAAAFFLAKAAGVKVSLKQLKAKVLTVLIPIVLVGTSYTLFLRGYAFDWTHPLTVFLDFGYPFGEAIYISIAVLAFLLSRKLLGGIMRNKIFLLIIALLAQYVADFNFIYQAYHGTWADGGYGDFLYLVAYFILGIALLNMMIPQLAKSSPSATEQQPERAINSSIGEQQNG